MARRKITLNEDHITLLKNMRMIEINNVYEQENVFEENEKTNELVEVEKYIKVDGKYIGYDTFEMYDGFHRYEAIALLLGKLSYNDFNNHNPMIGLHISDEVLEYVIEIDNYIMDNFLTIDSIVKQYLSVGLKPGIYTEDTITREWKYKEE